jgi:hypothetical protein
MHSLRPFLLVPLLAVAACQASYPAAPDPASVAVFITSSGGPVAINAARQFDAFVIDRDGIYERVTSRATWTTSDPGVARQSAAPYMFIGAGPGEAVITTRFDGLTATFPMFVLDPQVQFPRIEFADPLNARIGDLFTPRVILRRAVNLVEFSTGQATLSSSNPSVASTDGTRLQINGIGTSLITISLNQVTGWYWLSVVPPL